MLREHNSDRPISSHIDRSYASAMLKKLRVKFKDELKKYHLNSRYLANWLQEFVAKQYGIEFVYLDKYLTEFVNKVQSLEYRNLGYEGLKTSFFRYITEFEAVLAANEDLIAKYDRLADIVSRIKTNIVHYQKRFEYNDEVN